MESILFLCLPQLGFMLDLELPLRAKQGLSALPLQTLS